MKASGRLVLKGVLAAVILAVGIVQFSPDAIARVQESADVPTFEVDPFWYEPLEYPFILGSINGVTVAPDDAVLIVHGGMDTLNGRTEAGAATDPVTGQCCAPSPPVIEYGSDGSIVRQWGGESTEYTWPAVAWGIAVDPDGNVWIGGMDEEDTRILKFSREGDFIAEYDGFQGPAGFAFDAEANEAYVANSGGQNVVVVDIDSGEVVRSFGAGGGSTFGTVTCVARSDDGLLYVCDRSNNRIQVFNPDGTFVSEVTLADDTEELGSVWEVAFSADAEQQFLYVADGSNDVVHILDRATLDPISHVGRPGRYPGHFFGVAGIATDSQGNVYTGESLEGKRVQKFVFNGVAPAEGPSQGVAWPAGEL